MTECESKTSCKNNTHSAADYRLVFQKKVHFAKFRKLFVQKNEFPHSVILKSHGVLSPETRPQDLTTANEKARQRPACFACRVQRERAGARDQRVFL